MDSEHKALIIVVIAIVLGLASLIWVHHWRLHADLKTYAENGYTQKQVPDTYKTIWVIDPNAYEE